MLHIQVEHDFGNVSNESCNLRKVISVLPKITWMEI